MKDYFNLRKSTGWHRACPYIFALFAMMAGGVSPAWADTLTENFNGELPSGWSIVGDLSQNSDRARSGKGIWTSSKSDNANYLVTEAVEGSITFYARAYNKNTAAYVFIYEYDGSTLGNQLYATANMRTSTTPSWSSYTANLGTYKGQVAIALNYAAIDDVTYTQKKADISGPAFVVKEGEEELTSPYTYSYGLATAGTTKEFTLSNPGTEALGVSVTETGNFGATLSASSIAAGGEVTLTLTMPAASGSSEVTITPDAASGIDPFVINVSGTIRDANKIYETLGSKPDGWTTTGTWSFNETTGATTTAWYLSSDARLITPLLTVANDEVFIFEAKGNYEDYHALKVEYSADGTNWTASQTSIEMTSEWQTVTISDIPAGEYYIALHTAYSSIRNFYGGEKVPGANFAINISEGAMQDFGSVRFGATAEKSYSVTNNGDADLTVAFTDADDFYVPKTVKFTKPDSWSGEKLYMYAYGTSGTLTAAWPGDEVNSAAQNDMNQWVYTAGLPKGASTVIFNDGTNQTPNISTDEFKYVIGLWLNGSTVEIWENKDFIVAAGGTATFTVKMVTTSSGDKSGNIDLAFNALNATSFSIPCKGNVKNANYLYVDFEDGQFPGGWQVGADWKVSASGYAYQENTKTASAIITTPLTVAEGETLTFKAARNASGYGYVTSLKTRYSTNGGATWSDYVAYSIESTGLTAQTISGIPAGTVIIEFLGSNIKLDDIEGLSEAVAPALYLTDESGAQVVHNDTKDFGNLTKEFVTTYTLKNIGNVKMTPMIIATNDAYATFVNPDEDVILHGDAYAIVPAGKSVSIKLTIPFKEPYGDQSGILKIYTEEEDWVGNVYVNFTANTVDPTDFVEDFTEGKPAGWYSEAWTFDNGVAYVNNGVEKPMITELLAAEEGKNVLSFDAFSTYDSQVLNVYTSTDRKEWTLAKACNLTATSQTFTLSALADGNYYIKFGGALATTVDNIKGLKKTDAPAHDLYLVEGGATLPTADITPIDTYTASVKVASLRADEEVTADLYFGDTKVATATKSVATGATETITVEGKAPTSGTFEVYVKVNAGEINDETEKVSVTVADVTELTITAFAAEETNIAADENNDFTATFNVTVKNNGSTNILANNVSVSVIDNANAENVYTATWDASTSDVLYMNSSNGTDDIASDNAKLGVWMWGNSAGEWGTFTKINDGFYSVNLKGNTGFIIVRTASDKEFNLDDCWNKTGDMSLSNGNLVKFNGYSGATINFDSESMTMLEPTMSTTLKITVAAPAGDGGNFAYKAKENVTNTEWNDGYGETTVTVKVTAATIVLDETVGTVLTGKNRKVQLKHTFVEGWNTVCLPFSIEAYRIHMQARALAFTAYDATENALTFSPATTLEAGKPYVIYVPAAITEPMEFTGVTIASTEADKAEFNGVTFQGTYAPMAAGSLENKWGLTSAGKIAQASVTTTMKGFRAYFEGIPANANVRFLDESNGISTITADGSVVEGIYNLQGQKMVNAKKGVYIVNGKKVVLK